MTIINQKSISGITSITFASAGDDLLTFHSNNGTERFRIDNSGNTKITAGIVTTLTVTGNGTVGGTLNVTGETTFATHINLGDSDKAKFGTSGDLEIYHDGTDTWVDNTQGDLYLRTSGSGDDIIIRSADDVLIQTQASEGAIIARGDGEVELYHNNDKKLETTSTGVTITGTATATEGLVLDGQTGSGKGLRLDLAGSGDYVIQETTTDDVVQFGGTGASNFFVHNISTGNISIGTTTGTGNLNVAGTGDFAIDLIADIDNNGSNQWPVINFRRHSATGTPAARIYQVESHGGLVFDNGGSERLRILSGGGLTFNGDSATANALDDYEEGTWTPVAGTNMGTFTGVSGGYTKIGRLVMVNFGFTTSSVSTSANSKLTGLPFNPSDLVSGSSVGAAGIAFSDDRIYCMQVQEGSSTVIIETDRPIQGSTSGGSQFLRCSMTYMA